MSIDSLSTQLLTQIFEYLEFEEMKTSTLVSKKWNQIISISCKFLKTTKIVLHLNENEMKSLRFTRKYQQIYIKLTFHPDNESKKILFENLNFCSTIEELYVDHQSAAKGKTSIFHLETSFIEFPNLKKLNIKMSDWILSLIRCENLESLNILPSISPDIYFDNINLFLSKRLFNLKSITLTAVNLGSYIILNPDFKWKNLNLFPHTLKPRTIEEFDNWKRLISAADTNSTLHLDGVYIGYDFLQFILNEIAVNGNIVKLVLGFVKRIDDKLANEMKELNGIKILDYKCNRRDDNVELLFMKIPNIETLIISYPSYDKIYLKNFNAKLEKLKNVKITFWDKNFNEQKLQQILMRLKDVFKSCENFEIINTFTTKNYKFNELKNEK